MDVTVCDGRNPEVVQVLDQFDVIFLSGGHVPTENRFFHAIGLAEVIRPFFALSDGSFNMQEEGLQILFGPGYWIDCGQVEEFGTDGEGRII